MTRLVFVLASLAALAAGISACGDEGETTPAASPTPGATETPEASATSAPSPTPLPDGWEVYVDPRRGFSFAHPPGLTLTEEFYDLHEKDGLPAVQQRALSFRNAAGVLVVAAGDVPNPGGLTLEEWKRTYPGWASEPEAITVDGEPGLLFPVNQMGHRYPAIYLSHGDFIYIISANVYGTPGRDEKPPGISETDFERVIQGFRFGSDDRQTATSTEAHSREFR